VTHSFDILDPAFRRDPYPSYAVMRREHPVCRVEPGGMWAISRHEDVRFVLMHPEVFSSSGFREAWEPAWVGYNPLARSMLATDPPAHTRLRALVQQGFGPRAAARLEARVGELAEQLARSLEGELEAVETMCAPLPAFVIGSLLGLDARLHAEFQRWADDILSITPEPPSEAHAERVKGSIAELSGYLREVVADRRRQPTDDTVTDLIRAEVEGQALSTAEIVDFLVLLLLGGLETTTHLMGNALRLWSEQPELLDAVRAEPGCLGDFIDELLRYDGAAHSLPRLTTRDVELHGVTIPEGSLVMVLLGAANRDERVYAEPDRFDIGRRARGGLAFGRGLHFCLGAGLARMEVRAALAAVAQQVVRIEPCDEPIEYNRTLTVRGPVRMRLRFERAGREASVG